MAEAEEEAVVDAVGLRGQERDARALDLLLVLGLDLAGDVALPRDQRADAHAVLAGDDDLDGVEVGASLVGHRRRRPGVLLAGLQDDLGPHLLGLEHEGAGADDRGDVAGSEAVGVQREGGVREEPGVDRRGGLREARGGGREVEADGVVVHDLAVVVVVDGLGDGELARRIALAEQVEVLHDVLGGQGRAVGVGDVGAQGERELRGVVVDLRQGGRDPRLELEGVGLLVQEAGRDVVDERAVGVEAARRRVQGRVRLVLEVGEGAALDRVPRCGGRASRGVAARGEGQRREGAPDEGAAGDGGRRHEGPFTTVERRRRVEPRLPPCKHGFGHPQDTNAIGRHNPRREHVRPRDRRLGARTLGALRSVRRCTRRRPRPGPCPGTGSTGPGRRPGWSRSRRCGAWR